MDADVSAGAGVGAGLDAGVVIGSIAAVSQFASDSDPESQAEEDDEDQPRPTLVRFKAELLIIFGRVAELASAINPRIRPYLVEIYLVRVQL